MHMADALLSPAIGGTMWAATAGTIAYCSRRVKKELDDSTVPLMGVLAAFVFAVQMINFTIPATGSSGHLGGGMILAVVLGPPAAFLSIASVLTVQALFFADGGLLALGCNIFNLGFFPCFIAYPLIYRQIVGPSPTEKRIFFGSLLSAVVGLQLGAFGVVMETVASGVSDIPFNSFVLLMQSIHLAIGSIEGVVTATVILLLWKARPEILAYEPVAGSGGRLSRKMVLSGLLVAVLVAGSGLSRFASSEPDGLEWSIAKIGGAEGISGLKSGIHVLLADLQDISAFLPGYRFSQEHDSDKQKGLAEAWPVAEAGTTVSGLVGGLLTLSLAALIGFFLKRRYLTRAA